MNKQVTVLAAVVASACGSPVLAQGTAPADAPAAATAAGNAASALQPISAAEASKRMLDHLRSTGCLHIKAHVSSDKVGEIDVEAWMTPSRLREEIRKNGGLLFAQYAADGRIQEFVPQAEFKFGSPADAVLLEYANGPENDQWPRLIGHDLACEGMGVAGDSWLRKESEEEPTIPQMMAINMDGAQCIEQRLSERRCWLFRSDRPRDATSHAVWELYLDRETCEPVRQVITFYAGDKITKRQTDYTLEHLKDDKGVEWRLDAKSLHSSGNPLAAPQPSAAK